MSEDRVRLRLAGDADPGASLPVAEESARSLLPSPSIALAGPGAPAFASMLAAEAARSSATVRRWSAQLRMRGEVDRSAGAEGETRVRAPSSAIGDAIDALVADEGAGASLWIAVGGPFVSLRRATVSILVTGGASPLEWEPSLRALRDRFDLVISEPRGGLARELVHALLAHDV